MEKGFPQMDENSLWKFGKRQWTGKSEKGRSTAVYRKGRGKYAGGHAQQGVLPWEVRRNIRERRTHVWRTPFLSITY